MKFQFNDGGRKKSGYKGFAGDCVVRAISIATGLDYKVVYDDLKELSINERITKKQKTRSSVRNGVRKPTYKKYIQNRLGWKWVPTMFIGEGCKVHLSENELPKGNLIVVVSRHLVAVIDGIIHDTYDCSRNESRCVYGYWIKEDIF